MIQLKHVTRNLQNTRARTTVFRIEMGNENLHITNQVCQAELHKHVERAHVRWTESLREAAHRQ